MLEVGKNYKITQERVNNKILFYVKNQTFHDFVMGLRSFCRRQHRLCIITITITITVTFFSLLLSRFPVLDYFHSWPPQLFASTAVPFYHVAMLQLRRYHVYVAITTVQAYRLASNDRYSHQHHGLRYGGITFLRVSSHLSEGSLVRVIRYT